MNRLTARGDSWLRLWWLAVKYLYKNLPEPQETECVGTAIHICQMGKLAPCAAGSAGQSRLDGGHACLTLIKTLWKHALAWGYLSLMNRWCGLWKVFFCCCHWNPYYGWQPLVMLKPTSLNQWPQVFLASPTGHSGKFITQACTNSLHATLLFSYLRAFSI